MRIKNRSSHIFSHTLLNHLEPLPLRPLLLIVIVISRAALRRMMEKSCLAGETNVQIPIQRTGELSDLNSAVN